MPPTPNLTQLLSKLRAPIFNTLAPASNARTGTKYLRRRLRGPSVLNYVPTAPKLASLNSTNPWNKYAGWQGNLTPGSHPAAAYQLPAQQVVEYGFVEVERGDKPAPPKRHNERGEMAGWLADGSEKVRFEDVAKKRRIGKGPPKKGQGRRSQMKKK